VFFQSEFQRKKYSQIKKFVSDADYLSLHTEFLTPLDIKIDVDLFHEEIVKFNSHFEQWGSEHTHLPRSGIALVNQDGILKNQDPINGSLYEWNKKVFDILNNTETSYIKPKLQTIKSESAVAYETLIHTQFGKQKIHTIKPGTFVYDENNTLTKVLGVVKIDPKTITGFYSISISSSSAISNASWIKSIHTPAYTQISTNSLTKDDLFVPSTVSNNFWHSETKYKDHLLTGYDNHPWYNLITESGSFTVCDVKLSNNSTPINISMRDFTDVGHTKIDETYEFTMDCLRKFHSTN
jgi:hypothetical protein